MSTAVVIGSGIAGLTAALRLQEAGVKPTILTMGLGGLQLSQGTIDILGYNPDRVTNPLEAAGQVPAKHPYHTIGVKSVEDGVRWLAGLVPDLVTGDPTTNVSLPTVVGAIRPTALYSPSMAAGILSGNVDVTIVGFKQFKDFYPELIAGNLSRQQTPDGGTITAHPFWVDFPVRKGESDTSAVNYARAFDHDANLEKLAWELSKAPGAGPLGLPAFLGLKRIDGYARLSELTQRKVFEITGLPPSVPGMRLNEALRGIARSRRIPIIQGAKAVGFTAEDGRITGVTVHAAGHDVTYKGDSVIYAGGGFASGALQFDSYGKISETLFGLPLVLPEGAPVHGDYWGRPQPLFEVGCATDASMRPVDSSGAVCYSNLYVVGDMLAGTNRWDEKSGEGIAIGSATVAAAAASEAKEK